MCTQTHSQICVGVRLYPVFSSGEGPFPAKIFLSKQDTVTAGVKKGILKKGERIEAHMHSDCDQIEYYLEGKASMFIEGLGERDLEGGSFTYIPKGTKHGISKVTESLVILTVFVPPIF